MKQEQRINSRLITKVASALMLIFFTATTMVHAKQYIIYGDKRPGTKFRQVEATSEIPFNKSYKKLSAEQKALFRKNYEVIADNETPPFPSKGLREIYKPLIKGHLVIKDEGDLFVVAMVDETGTVENVGVYASPSDEMTNYATAVFFNTKFDPATCQGKPCKMEFPFKFKLRPIESGRSLRSR